jgi:CRP/FNR family transcriptional regulator
MSRPTEDLLRRLSLFRRVSAEDRARIVAVSHLKTYAKGELIFAESDAADTFLTITEGRVKVFKATPAGKEIILEIFGAGDPLGAVAVYESTRLPASAIALDNTECLAIARQDFFQLLEQHPALVRALLSGLTLRLADLTRRLAEMMGGRVEARFARLFLKLAEQIGKRERGGIFVAMPLARQELADLTGTTIETAIRIMSRWQKEDTVRTEKDGFVIVDRTNLETIATE